ncbi:hypothetical protein TW81_02290 [Vibrio galatheae]|uniref:Uncharacterized protein n=1 Tax=Vibrio galatheae TaxID=579748 RepID=A0A0F4NP01_9VIBR|nr:hypothetical protein [Vibrio galatheae]KJY84842.1 hypothetical protein TW81_02290 [Vibrio galatheae]
MKTLKGKDAGAYLAELYLDSEHPLSASEVIQCCMTQDELERRAFVEGLAEHLIELRIAAGYMTEVTQRHLDGKDDTEVH